MSKICTSEEGTCPKCGGSGKRGRGHCHRCGGHGTVKVKSCSCGC